MPNSGFSWGAKLSEIADAVWTRATRTLTNLDNDRAARIDNLDVALSSRATAADVWGYASRTLTQAKFPWWSAIITQIQSVVSMAASTTTWVNIQPPAGETWLISIAFYTLTGYSSSAYKQQVIYADFDGTTRREHSRDASYYASGTQGKYSANLFVQRVINNTLYASLGFVNSDTAARIGYYGYSGFKLSQPQWSSQNLEQVIPYKRPLPVNLKPAFSNLSHKAYLNPEKKVAYHLATKVLAVDPVKNVPVETVEYHILEDELVNNLALFKNNPKETGWEEIFSLLAQEGVML